MNETILYTSQTGTLFTRKDGKNRSQVIVRNERTQTTFRTYRMNNVPFYEHPLLSWQNLDCCGGWAFDETYLRNAVQNGTKPAASIVSITGGIYEERIVAMRKTLADLFDLDEIFDAYRAQEITIDAMTFLPYTKVSLADLMTGRFRDFDFANPKTDIEWIVDGLLLGYPIESTASILMGY